MLKAIGHVIARKLAPEMDREARRYRYLELQIDDACIWLDDLPDARDVARWLRERDTDHWRAIDEPASGKLPSDIYDLREHMRRRTISKEQPK